MDDIAAPESGHLLGGRAKTSSLAIEHGDLTIILDDDPITSEDDFPGLAVAPLPPGMGPEAAISTVAWGTLWRWLATRPLRRAGKRSFDLVVGCALLLLFSPVMIFVGFAVSLTSPGGVLFRHERLAQGGGTFGVWKFRTMACDADARLQRLLENDPQLADAFARDHKLKDDPRVTRVGRVLRRLSLDELPQLLNVVRGQMSLVGPRPIVESEKPRYGEYVDEVLTVRPGMTGIWQISGRNDLPYWRRVQLDVAYASGYTLTGDVVILLSTARAVLGAYRSGAY